MADTEIDEELAKSLKQAKKKPRNFAIVAKGQAIVKLIVSKKPIKQGELVNARKEFGGNAVYRGVVRGGGGPEMLFQVTEEPSLNEMKFKTFLKEQTGLAFKPRFEVVAQVEEVDDSEPDDTEAMAEPDASPEAPAQPSPAPPETTAPPPPPPVVSQDRQLLAALNKLTPAIKTAVVAHPDRKPDLLQLVAGIQQELQRQGFDAAKAKLLELGGLLKQLATGGPAPDATPPPAPDAPPAPKKEVSLVTVQKSRLAWDGARKRVQAELQGLERSILSTVAAHNLDEQAEDEFDEAELATAVKGLYAILDQLDTRLIDKLDEALNADEGPARQARHQEAAAIIRQYQDFVNNDPLIGSIDDNGFMKCTIRKSVVDTLKALAGAIG